MIAFFAPDFDQTIYASESTESQDWLNPDKLVPLERPYPFDMFKTVETNINAANASSTDYISAWLFVCRLNGDNGPIDAYIAMRFRYVTVENYIYIDIGVSTDGSTISSFNSFSMPFSYLANPEWRQACLIVHKRRDAPFTSITYNADRHIVLAIWKTLLYIGTWTTDTGHPDGYMKYVESDPNVKLAFGTWWPWTYEQLTERDKQNETVALLYRCRYFSVRYVNAFPTAYDGSYDPDPPDPYNEDPNAADPDYPSGPAGGDGNHDRTSDPIEVPGLPGVEGIDCGLMTLYYGNSQMIRAFLSNIWVSSIADAIKNFFQQPMDFIIGAMILPLASQLTAAKVGDAHPVFNNIPFESSLPYVETQYYEVDCGSLEVEKYWGSCFDYDPYTKIQIFLPYIGYRELLADEVMGHNIYCKYHIDACTGDCVAFVGVSAIGPDGPDIEKVLGQFNGNCGVKIPINSQSYDGAVAAGISMACTFAGIGLSMGLEAAGVGESQSVDAAKVLSGTTAGVVSNMKPNVARSGMFGQSAGYMGCRTPFIIKRIPRQSLPENYIYLRGYPSNIYGTLGSLSGFAAVEDIQLNNIPALEDERKEILEWLKGGVII